MRLKLLLGVTVLTSVILASSLSLFRAEAIPPSVDLSTTTPDFVIYGENAGDRSGQALAVGDINGDTIADLIIGAPRADGPGGTDSGKIYVIYGTQALSSPLDLATTSAGLTIYGDDRGDQAGQAVASGDINGDGIADLIIGAFHADGSGTGTPCDGIGLGDRCEAGDVYVIYGGPALPAIIDLDSTSADLTLYGRDAGDRSGQSIAAGDVNGDTIADLIIGTTHGDGSGGGTSCGIDQVGDRCDAGETYVIYGGTSLPATIDLNITAADVTIYGDDFFDGSGSIIATGDINDDGFQDVIINAGRADGSGVGTSCGAGQVGDRCFAGETYVIYGGTSLPAIIDLAITAADVTVYGDDANDGAANPVLAGRINDDLVDDLIIGAFGADGSGIGTSCGVGEVGDRCDAGEVYVIYGGTSLPATIDLDTTAADVTVYGNDANDAPAVAVAIGDVDDDGYGDLVMGFQGGDGSGIGVSCGTGQVGDRCFAGDTYIIHGGASLAGRCAFTFPCTIDLDSSPANITVYGDDVGDGSGQTVASGDINGDGIQDLIIGAFHADGSGNGTSCGTGQVGDRCEAGETYVIFGEPPPTPTPTVTVTNTPTPSIPPTPTPTPTITPTPTWWGSPKFDSLLAKINGLSGPPGIRVSLTSKVNAAQKLAERSNPCASENVMGAFINQVKAASGTRIPTELADALIAQAGTIIGQLDQGACPPDDDTDEDLVNDSAEVTLGTNPLESDTDGDTLIDGLELFEVGTDPLDPDTDDNGTPDAEEDPDTDGCTTAAEIQPKANANTGGGRNPVDFWDFYDVAGLSGPTPDGVIDLLFDILGVLQHYSPQGQPPYDVHYDRGPSAGPNAWNMTAPDGVIDLLNDILGVIQQHGHDCT